MEKINMEDNKIEVKQEVKQEEKLDYVTKEELKNILLEVLGKKEKIAREIDSILNERSQYVKNLTSLNNQAYLKLIGVFYNN